jgi:type VI secretion system protein ImpL
MRKLILRLLLSIIILVVLLALGNALGWWDRLGRAGAAWLWWLLVLLLVGALSTTVVIGVRALRAFLPRYRERRFLTRLHTDDTPPDAEAESYRQLQEKMQEAVQTLAKSPDLRKQRGLPLYAVPWYLCIGASQSGKTTLLRGVATSFAPFAHPPSTIAPTQNCDWWFFNTAIILDTVGHYAFPKNEVEQSRWYRFLRLLRTHRALQPINGLIIALPVDTLAAKRQEEMRLEAAELRKRVDEAIRELGIDFPVYLLITRCDTLEGFTEFFDCLPEQTLQQVFGYIHEPPPQGDQRQQPPDSTLQFEPIAESLVERLKQLRLAIFNEEKLPSAILRQRIFCFPEEFQALLQPLNIFIETLLAENPLYHLPSLRGIFFSSAQQQGPRHSFARRKFHFDASVGAAASGTKTYFLHDFFAVVLPRDRALVTPTRGAVRGRWLWHFFGFSGCAALCLLLIFLLLRAFVSDRRVYSAGQVQQESCTMDSTGKTTGPLLEVSDTCRQIVQALIEQNRQRAVWSKLFNRSVQLEEQLRQRYVEQFATGVLAGLDTSLSQRLNKVGTDTIPLVFLLIKRIELLNQCLSRFGCPEAFEQDLRPDYQLMLDPRPQQAGSAQQVMQLQYTYEAYLRWASEGPEAVLRRELEAHAERLRRWFAAKQFALGQIVPWANQNYAAVTLQEYWGGIPAADARKAPQVDGAYTTNAWKQSILPFLQRAEEAVPDMTPILRAFQEEYYAQYFKQWRGFLVDFPRGEALSREPRRRLASKFADENSPYNRILNVAFEQFKPWLPAAMSLEGALADAAAGKPEQPVSWLEKAKRTISQLWEKVSKGKVMGDVKDAVTVPVVEPTLPSWVRVLHDYLKSESRKAYLDALKQMREPLAETIPTAKSLQLVQAAFQDGKPTEKSPLPVLKAWGILNQFRDKEGMSEEDMKVVWPLLERPVLLMWKVVLESVGEFVQKSWADNVIAPTKGLSGLDQLQALFGPQGKVRAFAEQSVKPFLVNNESDFGQVLGEKLPLSPALLKALHDEKQLKPMLEEGKYQVQVTAGQVDIPNPVVNFGLGMEFQLNCDDKKRVCNPSKDGCESSATITWSPKSCGEPRIIISISCDRACIERAALFRISVSEGPIPLTILYQGQSGFLNFIREFNAGQSRPFGVNDFVNSALPEDRPKVQNTLNKLRISNITVRFHAQASSSLAKLMSLPSSIVPSTITR